jgi:hypothetical protein
METPGIKRGPLLSLISVSLSATSSLNGGVVAD